MTGIAIVGTGMWGPRLADAAQRADLEPVTCFSRDEGKRREFAERFGCVPSATFAEAIGHPGSRAS
jgi:predicted dehydrogenase